MKFAARFAVLSLAILPAVAVVAQPPKAGVDASMIDSKNGVEIQSLTITRKKYARSLLGNPPEQLEVVLQFRQTGGESSGRYLVKLLELAPIVDDAGTNLLTDEAKEMIPFLHQATIAYEEPIDAKTSGPVMSLPLAGAAKNATKIVSLKGKASVASVEVESLQFNGLKTLHNKPLNHPKLKKFPVTPTIAFAAGKTTVSLLVPKNNDPLIEWGLVVDDEITFPLSADDKTSNDKTLLSLTYEGDLRDKATLFLTLAEAGASKTYEFDFKNVELP